MGESLLIDLRYPERTGLAIRGITGLTPPEANINMTDLATSDGAVYNSARVSTRNVVLYFAYLYAPTIEKVRQKTYKFFPLKKKVKLIIETDNKQVYVEGYVETNEAVIFSDKTGGQISIMCPFPYLRSKELYHTTLSGVTSIFEVPFENASLTEDLLEFGVINDTIGVGVNIPYSGDSSPGLNIRIKIMGTVTNLMFYNLASEFIKIDTSKLEALTGDVLISGDEIFISTVKGSKEVVLLRDGVRTNIMNTLDRGSTWIQLNRGDNLYSYTADTGATSVHIAVEYRKLYEGV